MPRAPSRRPRPQAAPSSAAARAQGPRVAASGAGAFERLLRRTKSAAERRLERAFAARLAARASLGPELRAVLEAARDLSLRGGKRFRAALVVSAYRGVSPRASLGPAIAAGAALELLQSYLLVQDDWMDGDVERRGGPSVHVALERALGQGEHAAAVGAVLASDLLWGMALSELLGSRAEPRALLSACQQLARFHDDVVTGQVLDGLAHGADIEALHALKTGSYTVEGPLTLGAALAGADGRVLGSLRRFAAPLGVAFQLRDDLLGVFGTEAEAGRPVGSDLRAGKRTSVISLALAHADAPSQRAIEAVLGRRNPPAAALLRAQRAIEASGARREVEQRQAALCDRAARLAARLPLHGGAREELAGAVAAVRRVPTTQVAKP